MEFRRMKALKLLDHFGRRTKQYRRLAECIHMLATFEASTSASMPLRHIAKCMLDDCRKDEQLMLMIKLGLLGESRQLDFGIIEPKSVLELSRFPMLG